MVYKTKSKHLLFLAKRSTILSTLIGSCLCKCKIAKSVNLLWPISLRFQVFNLKSNQNKEEAYFKN